MDRSMILRALKHILRDILMIEMSNQAVSAEVIDESEKRRMLSHWFSDECLDPLTDLLQDIDIKMKANRSSKLSSIFSDIMFEQRKGETLVVLPKAFPEVTYVRDVSVDEYQKMFHQNMRDFKQETKRLRMTSLETFYQDLHPLFKTFTALMPSMAEVGEMTTISLYDEHKLNVSFSDENAYLIEYDLSGVQHFIYRVTEGGEAKRQVAKTVRGRSFYLSLLSDFIGYAILHAFELPYENLMVSTGGKGAVIVPKDRAEKKDLLAIIEDIEKMMFQKHQTDISVSFLVKQVSKEGLLKNDTPQLLDLDLALSTSKKQKFKSVLKDLDQKQLPHAEERCIMCQNAIDYNQERCSVCAEALMISEVLSTHHSFTVSFVFKTTETQKKSLDFGRLGHIVLSDHLMTSPRDTSIYHLSYNHHTVGDIKRYANIFAEGKSFSRIAEASLGDPKLFVMKMDVDNLGLIFLRSLSVHPKRYLKYLMLSRMLDVFFTDRLAEICSKNVYGQNIYISYSGGDDLVIVGPASMSIDLLLDINQSFKSFTGNHPDIHISSGIEVFHQKSPFRQSVKFADRHLEQSKSRQGKNGFTVFGTTMDNDQIPLVHEDISWFKDQYDSGAISKNIIQKIYQALDDSIRQQQSTQSFYRYVPLLSYMLERNMKAQHSSQKQKLKQLFVTTDINDKMIRAYHVISGMALLSTRGAKNKEESV